MASESGPACAERGLRLSMLEACSAGDISTLQRLFAEQGIRTGSKVISSTYYDPIYYPQGSVVPDRVDSKMPATMELLERAVAGRHLDVVKLILQTYPAVSLLQAQGVVNAVLENPDPAVLQALIDHEPNFVNYSVDYGLRTILSDACFKRSRDIAPVVHVLLDNGADVNDGYSVLGGVLCCAIMADQPLEVIAKIVDKGGMISSRIVCQAITKGRAELVEFLLSHRRNAVCEKDEEDIRVEADKLGDKDIIMIVHACIQMREHKRTQDAKAQRWRSMRRRWFLF